MTTDPYEIARRIANDILCINLDKRSGVGPERHSLANALLAAIEEGRRLEREHPVPGEADSAVGDLLDATKTFANLVKDTSGNIPTERLSFADWHRLVKAYDALSGPKGALQL